jgi:hypothetical protein
VLVWFAIFLFALIPLMALVVDLGMASLTRRQMQTAVDSAALEGLRFRDDATLSNSQRRQRVRTLVKAIYDDNLDDTEDLMNFGAGPSITFHDEPTDIEIPGTDFQAERTIRPENVGTYKPDMELNEDNELHGDIVFGHYDEDVPTHQEAADYFRDDFGLMGGANAALVRLRRTDRSEAGAAGLDQQLGISSSGPTVPYLFGRGLFTEAPSLNQREHGMVLRATAIARAVPARTVGVASLEVPEGVAPIWVEFSDWNSPVVSFPQPVTISGPVSLGQAFSPMVGLPLPPAFSDRYIPIYQTLASGRTVVVGFGIGSMSAGVVTKSASSIGTRNASATWRGVPSSLTSADLEEIEQALRGLVADGSSGLLLAPALQRTIP